MDEKNVSLALLGLGGVLTLFGFVMGGSLGFISGIVLLFALIASPLSFIAYKWGYWMIPYFTKGQRTIDTGEALYDIPPTDDAVVKSSGGAYYATIFLAVKMFKTTTSMSDDEKYSFMDLWERSISGLKSVTKYSVLLYMKDLSKYKEAIETRKAGAQMEVGKERDSANPNQMHIDRYEREIAMWDNIAAKLGVGDKPSAIITFVQATAKGTTKDGAIAAARQQANEVRTTIGTALNVEVVPLSGEEMKRCFDWSYSIPPGIKEL